MKQSILISVLLATFAFSACSDGTSLPEATGKGTIRAVNAIKASPQVSVLIEERTLGAIDYRQALPPAPWDDLEYDFNFEVLFVGDSELTRIVTQRIAVLKDMDYLMVLSGTIASPAVSVWENPERDFDGSETIFEARFAHTADSLGSVDVYFAAAGVAPVLGEQVGTLAFGEILPPVDYEAGDYILTVTTSDDPDDVMLEATDTSFLSSSQYTVSIFDGDANTFAPYVAHAYAVGVGGAANSITLPDVNFPPLVEYINGSMPLGSVDIYDDDMQSSLIVDDLAHKEMTAELALGDNRDYYVTPFDVNMPIHVQGTNNFLMGSRARVMLVGAADPFGAIPYFPDRRPVDTHAKLQIFSSTNNFDFLSVFVITADEVLEDQPATLISLARYSVSQIITLAPGGYDLYFRDFGETENLAGPIRIDVDIGDSVSAVIFDTVDPAVLEFQVIPDSP